MTVLILHGIGGHAGIHWQKWLHDQLKQKGHEVIMPNLPNSDHPDRNEWLQAAKKAISGVNLNDLLIVGHSLGVPTALDLIEKMSNPVKTLISVSGFADDYGAELNSYFLKEKAINFTKVRENLRQALVIYGDNDPYVPQAVLKSLADKLGVTPKVISNGGHLNTESGYTTFPDLIEIIVRIVRDPGR